MSVEAGARTNYVIMFDTFNPIPEGGAIIIYIPNQIKIGKFCQASTKGRAYDCEITDETILIK